MSCSQKTYSNRLVCLGDSLTQGFQSGAVFNNKLNYPAFLAQAMGIKQFKQASFSAQSGLPFNLEMLLKGIEYEFGPTIEWDEIVGLSNYVIKTIHRIKNH